MRQVGLWPDGGFQAGIRKCRLNSFRSWCIMDKKEKLNEDQLSKKDMQDMGDLTYMSEVDAALHRKGSPWAYILSLTVVLFFAVCTVWASVAELDEVTRGTAQVVPSQRVQEIQNLEGGILREIMVYESEEVEKDQIILRLDNEQAASVYRDAINKQKEHEAALIRLQAELDGKEPDYSSEYFKDKQNLVAEQMAIYHSKTQKLGYEVKVLESQLDQKKQEVEELLSKKKQQEGTLKLTTEQRDIARPLMQRGVYPRVDYLNLEQKVLGLRGEIEGLTHAIPRARRAVQEAEERISQKKSEARSTILDEMNKRRLELNTVKETLASGKDRVTRTDVRSPVKGTVKRIMINTIGGVVKPGESMMEIVPIDDSLLIEAKIRPADRAFLHPSQKAMVKITAYDFSIYGGLEATVEQISADTIEDRKGESHYLVKLRTKKNSIAYRGQNLPIIPGMTASVDILTGKKTVLDYLLKPILKAKQNALRER